MAEMKAAMLAGTLEKRARWRKEWRTRFCVMRSDHIDYYLEPPALIDDEHAETARGSIALNDAVAVEEPGRPHCIRVGDVLLSCYTRREQQRWLQAISAAGPELSMPVRGRATTDDAEEPPLLVISPQGQREGLRWHSPKTLMIPRVGEVAASVLLLDGGSGSGGSAESNCARAFCRLLFPEGAASEATFPVEPLLPVPPLALGCGSAERRNLRVRVHSNAPDKPPAAWAPLARVDVILALAAAMLLGNCRTLGMLLVLLAVAMLTIQQRLLPPPQRRVVFSVERLETAPASPPPSSSCLSETPKWVGRWKLDKACSEKYEPILADMGVNYLLRKAADTVKSALIISVSDSHVTIHVKTIVSVEDCMPLDGSWTTKPVPPGGRMKGQCRVRVAKANASELEMHTEFPGGEGELRDTLVMHEDGRSFTRTVVRGQLSVTRVFRREV